MDLNFPEQPPVNAEQLNLFTTQNFEPLVHLTNERLSYLYHDALENKDEYLRDIHFKCMAGAAERNGRFDMLQIKHSAEIRDEWLDTFNYVAAEQLSYHFNN